MSSQWPRTMPASRQPISMTRAKTCARGRNSIVDDSTTAWMPASGPMNVLRTTLSRFSWVSSHPLGRPVVPEV